MTKLPQHIEELFDKKFPDLPNKRCSGEKLYFKDISSARVRDIKSFIATLLEEEREQFVQLVEDVRGQYEHEVYGLKPEDSFDYALDHVLLAIFNLKKEDK